MDKSDMRAVLDQQRASLISARPEPLAARRDRIARAITLLKENSEALCKAMSADFGNRSHDQSMLVDIGSTVGMGKYCLKKLASWSRTEKRDVPFPLGLLGAKAELRYEPKGVVGILAPWNFPVQLSMTPLMQILAAGNRAMIKPSEYTERTSELLATLTERYFAVEEVAVFTGGPEVAQAFTQLPFDHLVFTGSTATGRKVMEAASANLVPLTLELGGKSPVVVGKSADYTKAGERIVLGKMMNAGQVCLAPDYLLVPVERQDDAVKGLQQGVASMYPTLLENDDYASIVTDRHFDRLQAIVADARDKGAEVIEVNPGKEDFSGTNTRKMPLTILKNVTHDMMAMQEELFGPILPIKTYSKIEDAIDYVNTQASPLGLYYFGYDELEREQILTRTLSGGITVNDVIFHVAMDDLPFGGIGGSGMGSYHGVEGFREFSHARSVYRQPKIDVSKLGGFRPPYGAAALQAVKRMLK